MTDFKINDGQIFAQHNSGDRGNRPVFSVKFKILGVEWEVALWPAKSGKDGSYSGSIKRAAKEGEEPESAPVTHKGFDKQGDIASPVDSDEIPF